MLLLIECAVPIAAIGGLVWLAARDFGRPGPARARSALLVLLLLGVLVSWPALNRSVGLENSGNWLCTICGALEEQDHYGGLIVSRGPAVKCGMSNACAERYARWFQGALALEYQHDWIPVGCHGIGGRLACYSPVYLSIFHASLPLVPDEQIARELALRLARADPARRRAMLDEMNRAWDEGSSPFRELALGAALSRDAFDGAFEAWLGEHPLWD